MLPAPFPASQISSRYGPRDIGFHTGIDWRCAIGTPIYASGPGTVVFSGWNGDRAGWVKTVAYDGKPYGQRPMYCHLNGLGGPMYGARVKKGDLIGYSGNSGNVTGPHLHLELVSGGDPLKLLFNEHQSVTGGGSPAGESTGGLELSAKHEAMIEELYQELLPGKAAVKTQGRVNKVLTDSLIASKAAQAAAEQTVGDLRQGKVGSHAAGRVYGLLADVKSDTASILEKPGAAITDAQIRAIADAVAEQVGVPEVAIDYDRIAGAVREKFRTDPMK